MVQIGKHVTIGALWMVGMRLIDRGIGLVSMFVLARLLSPDDFGVVAMAMTVFGVIEIGGQFGFDIALIRNRQASRAHYDSAWSMSVGYGVFTAIALAALAIPAAIFFNEPRLQSIMLALAAIALVQGFENIGVIDFRKNFRFGDDFQLMFWKKISSFVVGLSFAYLLNTYWALVLGIAASRITGVFLSYALHSYRPRFDLSEARGLLVFSRWILLKGIIDYAIDRGPDFIIGRFLGANALGLYRVARDISTLPTTELMFPIMRAVFPGYAAVAHDRQMLANSFMMVQGSILMITLPAGVGMVMLADPIVKLLLGPKWIPAVPLIQVLGLYGILTIFQATNTSVFNVLGKPHWGAALKAAEVLFLLPAMFTLYALGYQLVEIAWAIVGAQVLVIPAGILMTRQLLKVGFRDRLAVAWRPVIASAIMALILAWQFMQTDLEVSAASASWLLFKAIPTGMIVFASTILLLWTIAGAPDGPERHLLAMVKGWFPRGLSRRV
ncbi:lipopolysaccharide biosynthesis protein [Candidatus Accumulibacter vicinus]|uniref:Lipopolysaccharide biosynthesis protein WzxC n=1 Tax=Candidatus Accumulibacter vicinus TaxID=2954382 RepID=A0A084XWP0_9PROT|nr:lipopolysaccharide biosynthesis protein [Candidatus Accumulibacter vicinus]KFB66884.1 MAG: Lipopolysaccharide biosynthesis protein WzxC [Candidatus Accumulibacter vicinus]